MKIFKGRQSFELFCENALTECYTSDKHFINLLEGKFQKLAKLQIYMQNMRLHIRERDRKISIYSIDLKVEPT